MVIVLTSAAVTLLVLLGALALALQPVEVRVNDVGRYPDLLGRFPASISALAPPVIPPGATEVSMEYVGRGVLGPSSHSLLLRFRLPLGEAATLLESARTRAAAAGHAARPADALVIQKGDRMGTLGIDRTSGEVTITLSVN